jgi:hypothetical protein
VLDEALATIGEASTTPRSALLVARVATVRRALGIAAELYNHTDVAMAQGRREFRLAHGGSVGCSPKRTSTTPRTLEQRPYLRERWRKSAHFLPAREAAPARRRGRAALESLDEAEEVALRGPAVRGRSVVGRAAVDMWSPEAPTRLRSARRVGARPAPSSASRTATSGRGAHAAGDAQGALLRTSRPGGKVGGFAARGAFHLGMIGVLTANPQALTEAMTLLSQAGDRRLSARLLLYGGTVGADPLILERAITEARASGDKLLLVEALFASGTDIDRDEALPLASSSTRACAPPAEALARSPRCAGRASTRRTTHLPL